DFGRTEQKNDKEKKESNTVKVLIKELSTDIPQKENEQGFSDNFVAVDTPRYVDLYHAITKAEEKTSVANQDVIQSYYNFSKAIEDRFNYFSQTNSKRMAQALVNDEI